jgi:hypothetical protein
MTIENHEEVTEALEQHSFLLPSGEKRNAEVTNPRLDRRAPDILRVKVHRKGMTFKVIELAEEYGLKVGDAWQHDSDKADNALMLKLVPKEEN